MEIVSDIVLMSVGRKPNTDGLNLETAGLTEIQKDEFLQIKSLKQI
jgi:pyruvate/2-oxoglutarate dehydrogenase complex dihydrolipoamide dehydrogenase (E3) component